MKPSDVTEVQTYLRELRKVTTYDWLLETDIEALESHDKEPGGRDWSDYAGQEVLASHWLNAETAEEQASLGRITHLRALAWYAVHAAFPMKYPDGIAH